MPILAIPDDFLSELRRNVRKSRPLMASEIEELRGMLDDSVHDLVGFVPKVREWERWLVYLLQLLEVEAAGLDAEHPQAFEAMIERLRSELDYRLKLEEW